MPAKRKSFKVKSGNAHITVAPWKHPRSGAERWRYAYRPAPGHPWKYRTFKTKDTAEAAAKRKLESLHAGTVSLEEISPARRRWLEEINRSVSVEDQPRVLEFIQSFRISAEVSAAVACFLAAKISKAGEETPYLSTMRGVLENLARHFHGRAIPDIHLPDLQAWFETRTAGLGWKRRRDIRATLIQFWRWARKQGLATASAITPADRLPEIGTGERGARRILTPHQLHQLAGEIREEFRAWLVLGCFAGMRPEEIAPGPAKKSAKRGLRCEEIDWRFSCIRLPAVVSKGGKRPRIIPMSDALKSWLQWAGIEPGMQGPVCLSNPSQTKELERLGEIVFGGHWPKDICRHSYGSYRNAELRSLQQVAEEMGTSENMLHWHYHNPQPEAIGKCWFAQRPGVLICSDEMTDPMQKSQSAVS